MWCAAAHAQDSPPATPAAPTETAPAAAAPAAPATHQVIAEPLRIELKVDGVFECTQAAEIILRPKAWSALTVKMAAAHGQRVKKGDTVLQLESDKLEQQIVAAQAEVQAARTSLRDAEAELKMVEAASKLDLQAAVQAQQEAREALEYYVKVRGPRAKELAENSLKNARFNLEYAEEELKQLQAMYEADDLTEQTEEIILKRTKRSVDQAQFSLKSAEIAHDRTLQHDLPLDLRQLQEAAQRQDLALERARVSIPTALEKKRLDLEKLRRDQKQAADKLADLQHDLALMTVKAPLDGAVYYGPCVRGKWQDAVKGAERLQPGSTAPANQPLLTITALQPIAIRLDIAEKDLHLVRRGRPASVVPLAVPTLKLPAKVARIAQIPVAPGVFDCQVQLVEQPSATAIVPGMTCAVTIVAYDKAKAIVVPAAAVFTVEDGKDIVYVAAGDGKPLERAVTTGQRTGDKVEIARGLKAGDRIYLQKPAENTP
jgi:RND family efflux transporter MFP subunit